MERGDGLYLSILICSFFHCFIRIHTFAFVTLDRLLDFSRTFHYFTFSYEAIDCGIRLIDRFASIFEAAIIKLLELIHVREKKMIQ